MMGTGLIPSVRGRSILFQVLAPSLILVVLSFLAMAGVTAWSRASGASEMFRRKVELSASLSRENVTAGVWMLDEAAVKAALVPILDDPDSRLVMILDPQRKPLLETGDDVLRSQALQALDRAREGALAQHLRQAGYLVSVVPLIHEENDEARLLGHMVIVYDTASVAAAAWSTALWVGGVAIVATALIVALLVALMRRIAKPLDSLSTAMGALAVGQLDTPLSGLRRDDEIGDMARAVQVFKDNALRLRQAEHESARLEEERARADAANHAKGEFLAHMSHELRTPLNGVLTMAQLMAKSDLGPEQRAKLDFILMSGQDLLHVINDVLDFSKIEAGMLEIDDLEFDPVEVLEGVVASFAAVAERKGVHLNLHVSPFARGPRRGDPARLRQIVGNYVGNALKFTLEGGVDIHAEGLGSDGRDGLKVSVLDSGIGIEPESMARLFQRFSQIDASTTRKFGGTGLGLAICRELALHMGGEAWADSTPGVGSAFHVELPMAVVEAGDADRDTASTVAAPVDRNLRVLAAEDNPTNQMVLRAIMDAFDAELTLTATGVEAVEAWRRADFDVILMDVHMPDMDGIQATREIRAAEAKAGLLPTPIIALTANAFHHQVAEYAAAGMDDHVSKPIDVQALSLAIARVLQPAQPAEAVAYSA
jgi:signal transduction histidine kinase/ActR/RegA family two-component response regulator